MPRGINGIGGRESGAVSAGSFGLLGLLHREPDFVGNQLSHVFGGFVVAGADTEAVEYYVGHAMPGVRGAYLDAVALSLAEAVAKIPPLPTEPSTSNILPYVNAAAK